MPRKKQTWAVGDVFTVVLKSGEQAVGQVVGHECDVLNSVTVALFAARITRNSEGSITQILRPDNVFAVLFSTRDLLDSGKWAVIGKAPISIPQEWFPFENLRQGGFLGAKVVGSANIVEFANAYFGLTAWDDWKDPEYLDRLLLTPAKRPKNLKLKSSS